MSDSVTANYGWVIPAVGTSAYAPKINTDLQDIDTDLKAVSDAAVAAQSTATSAASSAASALAGGQQLTPSTITATGSSPNYAAAIDLSLGGPVYSIPLSVGTMSTLTVALTLSFSNRPALTQSKVIWVYVPLTVTSSSGAALRIQVAAGSSAYILSALAAVKSGTASVLASDYTIPSSGSATFLVAIPLFVLGS